MPKLSDLVDSHAHILLELLQDGDYVQSREPGLHCDRDVLSRAVQNNSGMSDEALLLRRLLGHVTG